MKILWIYSGEINEIFLPYSPDFHGKTKGIFMGSSYENTIKKAMKMFWKIHN